MKKAKLVGSVFTVLLLLLTAGHTFGATYSTYNSLSGFLTALEGVAPSIQNFDSYSDYQDLIGIEFLPGVSITSNMPNMEAWPDTTGHNLFAFDPNSLTNPRYNPGTRTYYDINFSSTYNAVAFDIDDWDPLANGPGFMDIFFSDGTSVSIPLSKTSGSEQDPVFFGIIANTSIVKIRWNEPQEVAGSSAAWEETSLDNLYVASTGACQLIDRTRWADLDFVRRIDDGALKSVLARYGSSAGNNLTFVDSASINSIQATVSIHDFLNFNGAFPRARIGGFFYNDALGTIHAEIGLGENGSGGLKGYYSVGRCTDPPECNSYTPLGYDAPYQPVTLSSSYNLSIDYDKDHNQFIFSFQGTPAFFNAPSWGSDTNQPKYIGTRVNTPSPLRGGYVDARFDNVFVKYNNSSNSWVAYDNFDSSTSIDRNNWSGSTLEFVREQRCDGGFGMALRGYGSFVNNGLNLLNGQNFNELQADLTVEQLINSPNLNPATPMAALEGNFFNAGGGTGNPGDQTGDIKALVGIRLNGTQPVGFYNIVQCSQLNCNIYPTEYVRLYYYEDPKAIGPDLLGKPHRVSIRYDEPSNTFTFGFDGRLTTSNIPLPTRVGSPNVGRMGPLTRVAFFNGLSGEGYVSAEFANIATVVDTDGDSVPDSIDNCPEVYNPIVARWKDISGDMYYNSQPDSDHDGYGDACDLCPKVFNDGGPCPASVGSLTASAAGTSINVTVTYRGAAAHLVPPDCNNVIFNSDPPIPQNCRRIPPYKLTVLEDSIKTGYGSPGGDWKLTQPNTSWTINCNLLDIFNEAVLKAASALGPVTITPVYTFFDTDRGLDPAGTCVNKDQGDVCVDISQYNLFQGTIPAQQPVSVVIPQNSLSIDIKPYTVPNTINLKKEGSIPVAIFSIPTRTPPFDAKAIDVSSLVLTQNGTPGSAVVVKNKGQYQFSYSDINGDGVLDLVVHFDIHGLTGLKTGQACVKGITSDRQSFEGCDLVTVVGK